MAAAALTVVALTLGAPVRLTLRAQESAAKAEPSRDAARSVREGVYTTAQARRGAARSGICASCHGADFEGDTAPPLMGDAFVAKWSGKPLGELFDIIYKDMPNDDPGTLSRRQSADYLAYILLANGLPTGPRDLGTESDALGQIRFEAKP
jgi:mono/diheme cytochrome c family protein